jgi:hypothetical protein
MTLNDIKKLIENHESRSVEYKQSIAEIDKLGIRQNKAVRKGVEVQEPRFGASNEPSFAPHQIMKIRFGASKKTSFAPHQIAKIRFGASEKTSFAPHQITKICFGAP